MNDVSEITGRLKAAEQQLTATGAPFELQSRQLNGVQLTCYKSAPGNLRDAIDAGRQHGDKTFLTFQDERFSFNEFFNGVDRLAHHLVHQQGISKGDRIAIAMRNCPEWMMAFAAVISIGAIVVPLNSWGKARELEYALADAGARIVFCDAQRLDLLTDALPRLECKALAVRVRQVPVSDWVQDWADTQASPAQMPEVELGGGDVGMIMYTSGTTGKPKGATSTHFAVCQALYNFEMHATMSAMANPKAIGDMMTAGFEPASLLAVPLFHVSGCYSVFLLNIRGGRKTSIMYKWDVEEALRIIERERITIFTGVPAMGLALLESPAFGTTDVSSLSSLGAGGSACPPHLKDVIYNKIPTAYPGTGYGMTETNATCSSCTGEAFRLRPTSAGTLSPIVECKTVDEHGNDLALGARGELYVKSPTNVQQYWNLPEASAATFHDGWVATGDVGYLDPDGFVYVVDRIKDMVIRGGENIYPVEVEGELLGHPSVVEAAVYGLPAPQLGEELAATVYCSDATSTAQLQAYLSQRLAGFKVPSAIRVALEPLPRNATGKLVKRQIRADHLAAN